MILAALAFLPLPFLFKDDVFDCGASPKPSDPRYPTFSDFSEMVYLHYSIPLFRADFNSTFDCCPHYTKQDIRSPDFALLVRVEI